MADTINIPNNPVRELITQELPVLDSNALIYSKGGGSLFPSLQQDLVKGGNQNYIGNPLLNEDLTFKSCESLTVNVNEIKVNSATIIRGLFTYNSTTKKYYWDEVYTSPLGLYDALDETTDPIVSGYSFKVTNNNSNQLYLSTNDVNIVPKVGDYLIIQRAFNVPASFNNSSYTDGTNSLPVLTNTELYQLQINEVFINTVNGKDSVYQLVCDKSIVIPYDSDESLNNRYILVLLNRKNTGIQKEVYYDTFEQIEVRRDQLLGDPYNNINDTTKPKGRKNYLNYETSQYMGLSTLLNNIIINKKTPFIVFSINDIIKDRILPNIGEFEFVLPFIMYNYDTRTATGTNNDNDLNSPNKIIEGGQILFEEAGIGNYCGLYFKWDTQLKYRIGYIFYDLRIIVLDDFELATALSYNSNRNYTLSIPILDLNSGNNLPNPGGRLNTPIANIISNGQTNAVLVTTTIPHGLTDGSQVYITDVYVTDINNNIIPASANGTHYAVLLRPNGPNNPADPYSFYLYDSTLTVPVTSNGAFYTGNPNGNGMVIGAIPDYLYFCTYRIKSKNYESTLPYSDIIEFNFALNGKIDNSSNSASLLLKIPKLKFLKDTTNNSYGFEGTELEIIIGEYEHTDVLQPNKKTGIKNIVSIPISALTSPNNRSLLDGSGNQNDLYTNPIIITLSDYNHFVSLINDSNPPYEYPSNTSGNTKYDIVNNFKHYNYFDGSDIPNDIVVGHGIWTIGNIKYQASTTQYRSEMQIIIPADKWNDTTNPTYDAENTFIKDRYISEIAIVQTDPTTGTEKPMIYTKIAPAIRKSNDTDLQVTINLDF